VTYSDRDWYRSTPRRPSFFDNPFGWSWRLGRMQGITVRLHLIFIIFIVAEILRHLQSPWLWWVVQGQLVLFGMVLLHELGHCLACRRVGGQADEILMWPLGGLAFVSPPRNPRAFLITTIGGPMVNLVFCVLAAGILLLTGRSVPINPLALGYGVDVVHELYVVNYVLLLFNLLPIYPLDGGRLFQELLWLKLGYQRSTLIATQVGMVGALLLGCLGLARGEWLLIGVAIFGFLTCWQERQMARAGLEETEPWAAGYDFTRGYGGLPADQSAGGRKPGFIQRRQQGRWAKRQEELRRQEQEVDRILAKVSREGLARLTRREKKILQQATEHQREQDRHVGRRD